MPTTGKIAAARHRHPLLTRVLAAIFALITLLVCALGIGAARLAMGPISLNWLLPFAQKWLAQQGDTIHLTLGEAALTWRDWAEEPTLSLGNVAAAAADKRFDVEVEAISGSLSVAALLAGQAIPNRLSATGVHVTALLPVPSSESEAPSEPTEPIALPSLNEVFDSTPLRFIDALSVSDASVTLLHAPDRMAWQGRIDSLSLVRGADGIDGHAKLDLDQGGRPGSVTLAIRTEPTTATTRAALAFENLHLPALADLSPQTAPLAIADLPLSGEASAVLAADGSVQSATLTTTSAGGFLRLTPALAKRFGIADAAQEIAVSAFDLQLSGQPAARTWDLDRLHLALPDESGVSLPAPIGKRIPLREITGRATLTGDRLQVTQLDIALDRPRIAVTGSVEDLFSMPKGDVALSLRNATVLTVRTYWPPEMAANAFKWVDAHIVAGDIAEATVQMKIGPEAGATTVTALQVMVPIENTVVDYLPDLPPVHDGRVTVEIDLKTLRVTILQAMVAGLQVGDGLVVIPDINADVSMIDIDFGVRGGLPDVIRILETKPADYLSETGLRPEDTGGTFDGRVHLGFPLLEDVDAKDFKLSVAVVTQGARVQVPGKPLEITDGDLRFAVTESDLHAAGALRIDGAPGLVNWHEDFEGNTPLRRSIEFRIANAPVASVRKTMAESADLSAYLLGGHFGGVVRYTERDDANASIDVTLELADANLAVPQLRWHKEGGEVASAQLHAAMVGGKLDSIPLFKLTGGDAEVRGSALFDAVGDIQSLYLDSFKLGRSQMQGTVRQTPDNGWDVTINGKSLDIAPYLEGGETQNETVERKASATNGTNLIVSANFDRVWIAEQHPVENVLVNVVSHHGHALRGQVRGQTESGSAFSVDVVPAEGELSAITVSADDAGATFIATGLDTNIRGGRLSGRATADLTVLDDPTVAGEIRIDRFNLVGAPLLARLLDILAVTGLREVLTGRGISFTTLRVPFRLEGGIIEIENARTHGNSLGITAGGTIDLNSQRIDVSGTAIPFFWANAALGNLPLIGNWLTGGETGGGIFSAPYRVRGDLDNPQVSVNPYSFMLPSLVRYILELIQNWIGPSLNGSNAAVTASP